MSLPHEIGLQPSYTRWLTEEVLNLIDLVRNNEAIYNPRNKYYFCRPYVENFWREIDLRLRKNSGASLAKWTNLRISFRREYANYQEEKVPPCWSYFDKMLFLHPYLRNKKSSEQPKNLEPHIQEALAKLNAYKPPQTTCESPVNEYMNEYLSYCEDDPPSPPTELDDIIEETNSNSVLNEVKSENGERNENETEDKPNILDPDDFKDIIIEITDDTEPSSSQNGSNLLSPQDGCVNRCLLKRPRVEISATANSNTAPQLNNVSMVRPLAPENNSFHNAITSSNRGEPPESPAARRNDFCECKSDSDAMFLMSLLTDIRKLNGRDRGKIKIAFQNIVQEYLYPE